MAKQSSRSRGWTLGSVAALIIAVVAAWFGFGTGSPAPSGDPGATGAAGDTCALDTLPAEATEVVGDIRAGGPFGYPANDGVHFGNYEGLLPREDGDFYREYTVETPGVDHRGARRIVTGGGSDTDPRTWYYTADHYESFCEIPDAEQ